jgi:hypothetical protein
LLSALVVIPEWPAAIGFIYPLAGLATIFPRALSDQDIQYTAMLPIRKGDVVKSKTLLIMAVQLFSVLFSIPFAFIKTLIINPSLISQLSGEQDAIATETNYILSTSPCLSIYGGLLLAFGVFNIILIPWYYKNPSKVNWPQITSLFVGMFILGIVSAMVALIPSLYSYEGNNLYIQIAILVVGILAYFGLTFLAEKLGEKHFDKVDL